MKRQISNRYTEVIIEIISLFFLILFMYAAFSKLLDYEVFLTQLNQSPFLSSITEWVSWGIPVVEIIIALLFFFPKLKLPGLYAALGLMLIFTAYIVAVLNFSESIPCSCGGVIASLSWNEHLIFNLFCITLALMGIIIWKKDHKKKYIKHQFSRLSTGK